MSALPQRPAGDRAVQKAVSLFIALAREGEDKTLTQLARERGIAPSSAYRLIQPFVAAGLLAKPARRQYLPGPALLDLTAQHDAQSVIAAIASPILMRAAKRLRQTIHLGVLEEDMVTYLLKAKGGREVFFTQEGMQLEAYCSGIGKALLAHMPAKAQEAYLAGGPFVALTQNTVTDPQSMRAHWAHIRQVGYAEDIEEISEGLRCIAVPIFDARGKAAAAISMSSLNADVDTAERLKSLQDIAREIHEKLSPQQT